MFILASWRFPMLGVLGLCLIPKETEQMSYYYIFYFIQLISKDWSNRPYGRNTAIWRDLALSWGAWERKAKKPQELEICFLDFLWNSKQYICIIIWIQNNYYSSSSEHNMWVQTLFPTFNQAGGIPSFKHWDAINFSVPEIKDFQT